MRSRTLQLRRAVPLALGFVLSLLSCGREVTGPDNGVPYGRPRVAALALDPQWPGPMAQLVGGSQVVPFERVRILLRDEGNQVVKDTIVDFPSTLDSLTLALLVPIPLNAPEGGVPMTLRMAYINAQGDTVFRAGPSAIQVRAATSGEPPEPISIPVRYDGVGANAASVLLTPATGTAVAGDSALLTAQALDAQQQPIVGTPLVFYTLDSLRALIPDPAVGRVHWLPVRGDARIVAALPDGSRADTSTFTVTLPATQLVLASGDAQTGPVYEPLSASVVLRTLASDGVPVSGVPVNVVVSAGDGSVLVSSDTSDANGDVTVTWTLGALVGPQSLTVTSEGLDGSPLTVNAEAVAGAPAQLALASIPAAGIAGALLAPTLTAVVQDSAGNAVLTYAGTVTVAVDSGPVGAVLGGTTALVPTLGAATFADLTLDVAGTYRLAITADGIAEPVLVDALTVSPAPAATIAAVGGTLRSGVVGTDVTDSLRVLVTDAFGNPVSGVPVAWLLASGAGTLGADTTLTDADGLAATSYTLGTATAVDSIDAVADGLGGSPLRFDVTAAPDVATQIVLVSAASDTVPSSIVAPAIVYEALDQYGNRATSFVSDVTLELADAPGDFISAGTLTRAAVLGEVRFDDVVFGPASIGYLNITTLADVGLPPSLLEIVVVPGPAANIVAVSGDGQTQEATRELAAPLVARLTDGYGNLLTGQELIFSIGTGGGTLRDVDSVSVDTLLTDVNGEASTTWILGTLEGTQTVDVSGPNGTTGAFSATATTFLVDITWAGVVSNVWTDPANWSTGLLPLPTNIVTVPSTQFDPLIPAGTQLRGLRVQSFNEVLTAGDLTITELLEASPTVEEGLRCADGSVLRFAGTAMTISGRVYCNVWAVQGTVALAGRTVVDSLLMAGDGQIAVGADTLQVFGPLRTDEAGTLAMTDPAGLVEVSGDATFQGGSTFGLLSAGTLRVGGNFEQLGANGSGSFAATEAHLTEFVTPPDQATKSVRFEDTTVSTFRNVRFTGGIQRVIQNSLRASAELALADFESVVGSTGTRVQTVDYTAGSSAQLSLEFLEVVGSFAPDPFSFYSVDTTAFSGANQQIPAEPVSGQNWNWLVVTGNTFVATAPLRAAVINVDGSVVVRDNGVLRFGLPDSTATVNIAGNLVTETGGNIIMQDTATTVTVSGDLLVGGGPSTLNNGRLVLRGRLIQTGSPEAFSAVTPHVTALAGLSGLQDVSFANPGPGVGTSHFGDLEFASDTDAGGMRLLSDAYADGSLLVADGALNTLVASPLAANGFVLQTSGSAALSSFLFENTHWRVADGYDVGSLFGLRFEQMFNGAVPYLHFRRTADSVDLSGASFPTAAPGAATYLSAEYIGAGADSLIILTSEMSPAFHDGNIAEIGNARIDGWRQDPEFRWLGIFSADWNDPNNWSDGVVPDSTRDVVVPAADAFVPDIPDGTVLQSLETQGFASANVLGTLTLEESLITGTSFPSLNCFALNSRVVFDDPAGGAVGLRGYVGCPVDIVSGTASLTGAFQTDTQSVTVAGTGALVLNGYSMRVGGSFFTQDAGTLQMASGLDSLLVTGDATFAGGATTGLLTDGYLSVRGNFSQVGADGTATFAASGTHLVEVLTPSDFQPRSITFQDATTSGAGSFRWTSSDHELNSTLRVALDLYTADFGGSFVGTANAFIRTQNYVAGSSASLTLPAMEVSGSFGVDDQGSYFVDTTYFSGTGQVIPFHPANENITPNNGWQNIVVTGDALFTDPEFALTANQSLIVRGSGNLTIGDAAGPASQVQVLGDFRTEEEGVLSMSESLAELVVDGSTLFAGGSTEGTLRLGTLRVRGDFAQGGSTPTAFAPEPEFVTLFEGLETQRVSFGDPGFDLSRFGELRVFQAFGASVFFNTNAFVAGQIVDNGEVAARFQSDSTDRLILRSRGANLFNSVFDGIAWHLFDGAEITGLGSLAFTNQSSDLYQWQFERSGGSYSVSNLSFDNPPRIDVGAYLRLVDPAIGDLVLTILSVVPESYAPLEVLIENATLEGWPEG